MAKNDGGPAFPLQSIGPDFAAGYAGMTLRDYFAAKALVGFMGSGDADWAERPESFAREAYRMADAMLAEREKGGAA